MSNNNMFIRRAAPYHLKMVCTRCNRKRHIGVFRVREYDPVTTYVSAWCKSCRMAHVKADYAKLKEALQDKADDVRVTTRLVDSPACLVVKDQGMSMQLARMLKQAGQAVPDVKPILEVNAEHALVKKLSDASPHFHDLAHILFDQALLAEGGLPEDPAAYVRRVNALLA